MNILIGTFLLFSLFRAEAQEVTLPNGNFSATFIDMNFNGMDFKRIYNSKSLHQGWFGTGWGSTLQTKLHIVNSNALTITENGNGSSVQYTSDGKSIALSDEVKDSKGMPTLKEGAVFTNPLHTAEKVVYSKKQFIRNITPNYKQIFDETGKLQQMLVGEKKFLMEYHPEKRKITIKHNDGSHLTLEFTSEGLLSKVVSTSGDVSSYSYKEKNLATSQDASKNNYTYQYGPIQKLSAVKKDKATLASIDYDFKTQKVRTLITPRGRNDYSYQLKKAKEGIIEISEIKGVDAKKISYSYAEVQGQKGELKEVVLEEGGEKSSLVMDSACHLPLIDKKGVVTTKYEYDDNCRLKARAINDDAQVWSYDSQGRVTQSDSKMDQARFSYDGSGKLKEIVFQDGKKIGLNYQNTNLTSVLYQNAFLKKNLTINYNYLDSKLENIKVADVGSLRLIYDSKGNVKKVTHTGDKTNLGNIRTAILQVENIANEVLPPQQKLTLLPE